MSKQVVPWHPPTSCFSRLIRADLHRIDHDQADNALPLAIGATFPLAEQLHRIDARVRAFEEFAAHPAGL